MTVKELRTIINNPSLDESARVFIEYPISSYGYITSSADAVRVEQDPYYTVCIISGYEATES